MNYTVNLCQIQIQSDANIWNDLLFRNTLLKRKWPRLFCCELFLNIENELFRNIEIGELTEKGK